jgi:hypothetical protein
LAAQLPQHRVALDRLVSGQGVAPGAFEVAAVTRRLVEGLLGSAGTIVPAPVKQAFESRSSSMTSMTTKCFA